MQGLSVKLGTVGDHGVGICRHHTVNFMIEMPWIGLETIWGRSEGLPTFQSGNHGRWVEVVPAVVGNGIGCRCLRLTIEPSTASLYGFTASESCRGSSQSIE